MPCKVCFLGATHSHETKVEAWSRDEVIGISRTVPPETEKIVDRGTLVCWFGFAKSVNWERRMRACTLFYAPAQTRQAGPD